MRIGPEPEADSVLRLWIMLHERFGAGPRFEIAELRNGYQLRYTPADGVTMSAVRATVDEATPSDMGVVLAEHRVSGAEPSSPPWFH